MVESRKRKIIEITDHELASRFRSKKDFYVYLSDNCKLSFMIDFTFIV